MSNLEPDPWRPIIKLFVGTFAGFLTLAALGAIFGVSNREMILGWIQTLSSHPLEFAAAVVGVLSVDSVLAIPTMATATLTGHILGVWAGGAVTTVGIGCAGTLCYGLARLIGPKFLPLHITEKLVEVAREYGILAFLLCRTVPMLPEVLSAMAGVSKMPYHRFIGVFLLGNAPFAFLGAFAGHISTVDAPWPGIAAGLLTPTLGVILISVLRWKKKQQRVAVASLHTSEHPPLE